MKQRYSILFAVMSFVMSFTVSCTKEESIEDVFVDSNSSISKSDVVAIHSFSCNSGNLSYELEVEFNDDFSGSSTQMCYDKYDELMSVNKYVFMWRIVGDKVLLNGISVTGRVESSNYNTSRSASFVLKHGVLVPDEGFLAGYAANVMRKLMEDDVKSYFSSTMELNVDNNIVAFKYTSGLKKLWPEKTIRYGVHRSDGKEFYSAAFYQTAGNLNITDAISGNASRLYKSLVQLTEAKKSRSLTQDEQSLMSTAKDVLKKYVNSFKKGDEFYAIVKIGDEVFKGKCTFSSKYSNLINY